MFLTRLLRGALNDKGVSATRASLEIGRGKTYLRDILNGSSRDPGIRSLFAVAKFLGIPSPDLIKAIEADYGQGNMTNRDSKGDKWQRLVASFDADEQLEAEAFRVLGEFFAHRAKRGSRKKGQ